MISLYLKCCVSIVLRAISPAYGTMQQGFLNSWERRDVRDEKGAR